MMEKQRDLTFDYAKGIGTLLVYLAHSILYHPIQMMNMYDWCRTTHYAITSFLMPFFFFVSGMLFAFSRKSNIQVVKDKTLRLLIPYVTAMVIAVLFKLMLPSSMSHKTEFEGDNAFLDVMVYGGTRWFVHLLMIVFVVSLSLRKIAKTPWVFALAAASFAIALLFDMPEEFQLDKLWKHLPYFLLGLYCNQWLHLMRKVKAWHFVLFSAAFVLCNIVFLFPIRSIPVLKWIFLPTVGKALFMSISILMNRLATEHGASDNIVMRYIAYIGKYSLQFYLFTFAYPIIRIIVVNVWHVTNLIAIVALVMVLQLLVMTPLVEITRRFRFFKIPMGY